ncbi:MAG: transposase [Selenomonadaceae bacterium]|nr:transposase [Selenomonadaceae bacterium]
MSTVIFKELSLRYNDDTILLCCDGAGWHKTKSLKIQKNIILFFIPPYTPEMNPIEQIWKVIRKIGVKNEVFLTLKHVVNCICKTIS